MKGFVSFILVLFLLVAILFAIDGYAEAKSYKDDSALLLEKKYYKEQDIMHAMLSCARSGAKEAETAYVASLAAGEEMKEPIENAMKLGIQGRLAGLEEYARDDEWDVVFWCGLVSEEDMDDTARKMVEDKKAEVCPLCKPISSIECIPYMQVDVEKREVSFDLFEKPGFAAADDAVGMSLYNRKYGFASVSFIPTSKRVGY